MNPVVRTLLALGCSACCSAGQANTAADPSAMEVAVSETPTSASQSTAGASAQATETAPLAAPAEPAATAPPDPIAAAVQASDRDAADRALDAGRLPLETLSFFGIAPGMRIGEVSSGGGYTTELLARIVGAEGSVWGHNTPFVLQRFAEKPWSDRLSKPVMANVTRVDREMESPFPPEVTDLDAVLNVLFYHDTVWMKTDRAKMNRSVFDALKPGGIYGVVDHSAKPGSGTNEAQTLHRIEESVVRSEVQAAGFVLEATSDVLSNTEDTRDWNAAPSAAAERRGSSDRFVLKFRKPQ